MVAARDSVRDGLRDVMNQVRMARPKILGQLWASWSPYLRFHGLELAQAVHADTLRESDKIREQAKRLLVTDK